MPTTPQSDPPKESRKRRRTELESLGPPVPQSDLSARGETRSGNTRDVVSVKRTRFNGRNTADYIYPSSRGQHSGPTRGAMADSITKALVERARADPTSSSLSRRVSPLKGGKSELKIQGVARDHIAADSRIRALLSEAYRNTPDRPGSPARKGNKGKALTDFFTALVGEEGGKDLGVRFNRACETRNANQRDAIIDEACNGLENLRFGDAKVNTVVSNEFDPVVIDGRLNVESMKIRDAVIGLAEAGVVRFKTVSDALSITKDRHTHQDVTSTVLRSATIGRETASRTVIDHFAQPKDRRMFARRNSLPPEETEKLKLRTPVRAPAREFHHLSRQPPSDLAPDSPARSDMDLGEVRLDEAQALPSLDDMSDHAGLVSDLQPVGDMSADAEPMSDLRSVDDMSDEIEPVSDLRPIDDMSDEVQPVSDLSPADDMSDGAVFIPNLGSADAMSDLDVPHASLSQSDRMSDIGNAGSISEMFE